MESDEIKQINNRLEILEKELLAIGFKFPDDPKPKVDIEFFIKVLSFIFMEASKRFYSELVTKGYALYLLPDYEFVDAILRIVLKELGIKPSINIKQFFNTGYVKQKIELCIDCTKALKENMASHGEIQKRKKERAKETITIPTKEKDENRSMEIPQPQSLPTHLKTNNVVKKPIENPKNDDKPEAGHQKITVDDLFLLLVETNKVSS